MKIKILIILGALALLALGGGLFLYTKQTNQNPSPVPPPPPAPVGSVSNDDGSSVVPADWKKYQNTEGRYSIFYAPDWEMDQALLANNELKTFYTKGSTPPEGFFIIQNLNEPGAAVLSYLDNTYAKEFRSQALTGTLAEERVVIQGRQAISLEAQIKNTETQETVTSYLLLIEAGANGQPGLAISAIMSGSKLEQIIDSVLKMTLSLRLS